MADAVVPWRNVLLAGARGLEYTFKAIGNALAGEQPVEISGYSGDHDAAPSQSGVTGRKKKGKRAKKGEEEWEEEKKAKRAPSAYNLFVAEQMKLRKAANPEIPNKEHFRAVAKDWKTSSQNKKNFPGASEAPAMTEGDAHLEDFEDDEAEGLLERTSEGGDNNEADAEVTGRQGSPVKEVEEEEKGEKEKEKKDKKRRKKERQADAQENGGTGYHRDEEEAAAEKRSSKKGKR